MNAFRLVALSLILLVLAFISMPAHAQVSVSVGFAPPPLLVDVQPGCPQDGFIWTPGYWAYDDADGEYYWVPGAWVQPPEIGFLWTPCYWGWAGNGYGFHQGYWGRSCGFYGGVNYGHGYWGHGYNGGRWEGNHFAYNTAANNVSNGRVHNTYVDRSVVRSSSNRTSYNGGHGGLTAQPTAHERQVAQQSHVPATAQQRAHFQTAAQTRSHAVKVNRSVAGGNGTQSAVGNHDAAFTGGDKQARKNDQVKAAGNSTYTGESPAQRKTETSSNHEAQTHVASQQAVHKDAQVAATHQAERTHVSSPSAATAYHAPAVSHHTQASAPQFHSASHVSGGGASHAQAHAGGGGGHSAGGGGGHSGGGGHH